MARRPTVWAALVLAAAVATAAVTAAVTAPPATAPSVSTPAGDDPALTAALERHLADVRFDGTKFADAIARLHDLSGANIDLRWDPVDKATSVRPDDPITYSATDRRLDAVLAGVLDRADHDNGTLAAAVVGHEVIVSTPGDLRRLRAGFDRHRAAHEPANRLPPGAGQGPGGRPLPQGRRRPLVGPEPPSRSTRTGTPWGLPAPLGCRRSGSPPDPCPSARRWGC